MSDSSSTSHLGPRISDALAWVAFATVLIGIVGVSAMSLPVPNIGFAQDLGIMIDAGWRFYQGLKPHADYSSPLGPLLGILFGLPFVIGGPEYSSLKLLPALASIIASLWAAWLMGTSVNVWVRIAVALAIGLFAGGIFHAGFEPQALTFATFYNRVGFGLLCLTGLSLLIPQSGASDNRVMLVSLSSASALALMFLLKVNFFVAGLALLGLSLATRSWTKRETRILIYAGLGWVVVTLYLIGFRPDLMVRDWAMAASARSSSHGAYFFPLRNLLSNVTTVALLVVCSSLLLPKNRTRAEYVQSGQLLLLLWCPAILGYALTLSQSHGDGRGIPTSLIGLVAVASTLGLKRRTDSTSLGGMRRVLAVSTLVLAATLMIPSLAAYVQLAAVSRAAGERQFEAMPLAELRVGPYNNWGEKFAELTNEATSLLARNCGPEDTLQYIDMANVFSFASRMRTPRGSPLWWDAMATFSLSSHPNLSAFDDTVFILLPKVPLAQPPQGQWMELYGKFLAENYREVEDTQYFRLFRRQTP